MHGFGNLSHENEEVYVGEFKNGKMHGTGKLYFHELFEHLIEWDEKWVSYEGEFSNGLVSGFGNLSLLEREEAVVGVWREGCCGKGVRVGLEDL